MSEYAKSLVPLGAGLVVGFALILLGERETGIAVLLAALGASGLAFAVPNRRG